MSHRTRHPYDPCKRAFDILGATAALLLLSPVLVTVGLLVLAAHGRPVLFCQLRTGRDGSIFTMVKFRTMRVAGRSGVHDRDRLTRVGRLLRATSLDELPTLWNVVCGTMSLVGPRPLLPHYLDRYTHHQARRHEVRPGITGLAQVRGRNALTWPERFAYDVWYVDHRGIGIDLRILVQTVWTVVGRRGVSAPGAVTAHEFRPRPVRLASSGSREAT